MSRETPIDIPGSPISHPRTLAGVVYPPHEATGWGPAGRRPPPTPLRGAGIRCLEGTGDYSVN